MANCTNRNLTHTANFNLSTSSQVIINSTLPSPCEFNVSNTNICSDSLTTASLPDALADSNPPVNALLTLCLCLLVHVVSTGLIFALILFDMCLAWKLHWQHEEAPRLERVRSILTEARFCQHSYCLRLVPRLLYAMECFTWFMEPRIYTT